MSEEFDSRKDSHSTKFERRSRILVKIRFTELCDSKLSSLRYFDKSRKVGYEFMIHQSLK